MQHTRVYSYIIIIIVIIIITIIITEHVFTQPFRAVRKIQNEKTKTKNNRRPLLFVVHTGFNRGEKKGKQNEKLAYYTTVVYK